MVDEISVIEPTDFSKLLISPGHDYATLLTCTPLMVNTHRLLVRGHRVDYVPEVEEDFIAQNKTSFMFKYLFYIALGVILLLLIYLTYLRKKKKRIERENAELKGLDQDHKKEGLGGDENQKE